MATQQTRRILVVDDSMAVRRAVLLMLVGTGLECIEASDGKEALRVMETTEVHCVISDLHMPVMDGWDFLLAVRQDTRYRFLPVLILTTDRTDQVSADLMAAGATGVLRKPIEAGPLVQSVTRAMSL